MTSTSERTLDDEDDEDDEWLGPAHKVCKYKGGTKKKGGKKKGPKGKPRARRSGR
jgi:hypothetical protein